MSSWEFISSTQALTCSLMLVLLCKVNTLTNLYRNYIHLHQHLGKKEKT